MLSTDNLIGAVIDLKKLPKAVEQPCMLTLVEAQWQGERVALQIAPGGVDLFIAFRQQLYSLSTQELLAQFIAGADWAKAVAVAEAARFAEADESATDGEEEAGDEEPQAAE